MRISRIIDHHEESIFDDKVFVKTFTLLLGLIIAIASFLIYNSFYDVHQMSFLKKRADRALLSLSDVERELNGNVFSLETLEAEERGMGTIQPIVEKPVMSKSHKTVDKSEEKQKNGIPKIQISSSQTTDSHTKPKIEITSTVSSSPKTYRKSFKYLKERFYKTNNPKYALQIAQRFYDTKQYKKALKWSLIANEIDEQNPKSWLMFAKTKVKMGKRQDAVNVLQAYLKTYTSEEIRRYLHKIKSKR